MLLSELTVQELIAAFRSPQPTPGGGSAAALAGAVGAGLLAMVASLNRPRASSASDLARLAASAAHCSEVSRRLTRLIDRDSAAYNAVVEAYRLPKGTEEQARRRTSCIQNALLQATNTPLEVMRECSEAIAHASTVAGLGNRNASSDVQSALELLAAGLRAAMANVETNLKNLQDGGRTAAIREEMSALAAKAIADGTSARRLTEQS